MSRAGYTDDGDDPLAAGRWKAIIRSATNGKRGQKFFVDLVAALDAMPVKRLIAEELATASGEFCALGALGAARGVDLEKLDTEDYEALGSTFDIAEQLAREVMYENDEWVDQWKWIEIDICGPVRPYHPDWNRTTKSARVPNEGQEEKRWRHVRKWASEQIKPPMPNEGKQT